MLPRSPPPPRVSIVLTRARRSFCLRGIRHKKILGTRFIQYGLTVNLLIISLLISPPLEQAPPPPPPPFQGVNLGVLKLPLSFKPSDKCHGD